MKASELVVLFLFSPCKVMFAMDFSRSFSIFLSTFYFIGLEIKYEYDAKHIFY